MDEEERAQVVLAAFDDVVKAGEAVGAIGHCDFYPNSRNVIPGKVVFTSSMGGLFTPANWGIYVSTKHALEAIAEAMQQELAAYGIKVQTINPGAYYTGYNETMADNPFRWLDDKTHFTKRAVLRKGFDVELESSTLESRGSINYRHERD